MGALTSGDLEGNGMPDIVVTSFSHNVTAFRLNGTMLWQWTNDDTILSGAVVGDIDRDGKPEVVVGGDSSNSSYYQAGGWVNVLSNTGQLIWRKLLPGEVTWSSPVVADLLNNGNLDIVIGTGLNYSFTLTGAAQIAATEAGDYIYAFDPSGNMLPGWPYHTTFAGDTQGHEVLAAPAVADLLGNGQLDVIALDRAGYIHVIQPNGKDLPGFAGGKRLDPDLMQSQLTDNYGSPIIADVTGNGVPDIIAGSGPFIRAFDPKGNLIDIGHRPSRTRHWRPGRRDRHRPRRRQFRRHRRAHHGRRDLRRRSARAGTIAPTRSRSTGSRRARSPPPGRCSGGWPRATPLRGRPAMTSNTSSRRSTP